MLIEATRVGDLGLESVPVTLIRNGEDPCRSAAHRRAKLMVGSIYNWTPKPLPHN